MAAKTSRYVSKFKSINYNVLVQNSWNVSVPWKNWFNQQQQTYPQQGWKGYSYPQQYQQPFPHPYPQHYQQQYSQPY